MLSILERAETERRQRVVFFLTLLRWRGGSSRISICSNPKMPQTELHENKLS